MKGGLMSRSSLTGRDDQPVVERISDTATFAGMREEWNELLEASAANCLFLAWEWLFTWWHHLSAVRPVKLEAVVRLWIMRSGDLDSSCGAQEANGERDFADVFRPGVRRLSRIGGALLGSFFEPAYEFGAARGER